MTRESDRFGQVIPLASALERIVDPSDISDEDLDAWKRQQAAVDRERRAQTLPPPAGMVNLLDAGFPRRAIEHALAADESNEMIARLRDWDVRRDNVFVMSGSKGIGKTVAAAWWALRRKSPPLFVRAATFAASSRYDRSDSDGKGRWLAASALVLDDLGAEFLDAKGSFLVDLDELVDVFYGDRRPLLITTNCPRGEFVKRYGERIVDRIRECGVFFEWSCPSLRGDR